MLLIDVSLLLCNEIDFLSEKKRVHFLGNLILRIEKKILFKFREPVVVDEMTNLPYVLI